MDIAVEEIHGSDVRAPQGVRGSRRAFIECARDMVPRLRERASQAEKDHLIAKDTHREFLEAGLYRLFQPVRYGGFEMDIGLMVDVAAELGCGCGSSTWILSVLSWHSWVTGMNDPRAQDDVWLDNPKAVIASSFPGKDATARRVDGGIVVDGTWTYSSGVDFADWNNLQVFIPRAEGIPDHYLALVPRSDYQIIDDWLATGLAGTGSKSIILEKVFIPEHRLLSTRETPGGATKGSEANPVALYKIPAMAFGAKLFSAVALGIARGAVEVMRDDLETRIAAGGIKLADQQTVQKRIAESETEIDVSWLMISRDCAEATELAEAEITPPLEQKLRWRSNDAYAGELCVRAVDRLQRLVGARGLSADSHFQRAWHDIHAVIQHPLMNWDFAAANYGKVRLGLEYADPRI